MIRRTLIVAILTGIVAIVQLGASPVNLSPTATSTDCAAQSFVPKAVPGAIQAIGEVRCGHVHSVIHVHTWLQRQSGTSWVNVTDHWVNYHNSSGSMLSVARRACPTPTGVFRTKTSGWVQDGTVQKTVPAVYSVHNGAAC